MPYSKQTWTDYSAGTPLSGSRLTHMEDGIYTAGTAVDGLQTNVIGSDGKIGGPGSLGLTGQAGQLGVPVVLVLPSIIT